MAASFLKFFRETALPSPLQPNSVYLITELGNITHAEMYIVGNTSTDVRRIYNKTDIELLIQQLMAGYGKIQVVATFAELDDVDSLSFNYVYVKDASGDPTVDTGGATYVWDTVTAVWVKQSEAESMDIVQSWAAIQGKPNSSVSEIDSAVAQKHTHTNMTQLNKINQDAEGNMTYNGKVVSTEWLSTSW